MPQLFSGNLLKLGLTQAVGHVGPMWNKVKLKFVSEAELECGEGFTGSSGTTLSIYLDPPQDTQEVHLFP